METVAIAHLPASKCTRLTEAVIPDSSASFGVAIRSIHHPKWSLSELFIMIPLRITPPERILTHAREKVQDALFVGLVIFHGWGIIYTAVVSG